MVTHGHISGIRNVQIFGVQSTKKVLTAGKFEFLSPLVNITLPVGY